MTRARSVEGSRPTQAVDDPGVVTREIADGTCYCNAIQEASGFWSPSFYCIELAHCISLPVSMMMHSLRHQLHDLAVRASD